MANRIRTTLCLQRLEPHRGVFRNSQPSTSLYPCYGDNGNIEALLDVSDPHPDGTGVTVAAAYEYGPFGEPLRATGAMAEANPFRFSTKYTDNETGMLYHGYRYYSPAMGKWVSRDPIQEQGGGNAYTFVSNGPIGTWDILGLTEPLGVWIATEYANRTANGLNPVGNIHNRFQNHVSDRFGTVSPRAWILIRAVIPVVSRRDTTLMPRRVHRRAAAPGPRLRA